MNNDAEAPAEAQPDAQVDPPSRKRPRVGSKSPEPSEPQRHERLWFEDGNVVLQAGDTMFRVYRGILCNASEVFRDMFSIPQPPEGETVDGVPLVRLYDSPFELADLLDVLLNGKKFMKQSARPTWPVVQSLYRLGTKYQMQDLRGIAVHYIKRLRLDKQQRRERLYDPTKSAVIYEPADVIAMANLASAFNFGKNILLDFLYVCCQLNVEQLLEGIPHSRGHVERLSPDLLQACIQGRENLILASVAMVRECLVGDRCRDADCDLILRERRIPEEDTKAYYNTDPLGFWDIPYYQKQYDDLKDLVCQTCFPAMLDSFEDYQDDIYAHLGQYIKLNVIY
ncbi:hypothetical protein NM688_g1093 [Phlebia brevispora]|uniref:Uncharacterized protein n=1 Tax=Phlebia brevispora TaxID=194682 RepID=A0ACC1TCI3_9APHY|nr:hypothetical protein NM688_g1093 [Phlebia brevispora]